MCLKVGARFQEFKKRKKKVHAMGIGKQQKKSLYVLSICVRPSDSEGGTQGYLWRQILLSFAAGPTRLLFTPKHKQGNVARE